ncbi:MAG: O-antigen ligase family protein [Sphingopyxis sp.]|nr:O-antigen ligase family protein [Sphingopyxis sp.]
MTRGHRPFGSATRSLPFAERATGSGFRLGAAIAFLLLVFVMGGGSRGDVASLVLLRPLAVLFAAYALWAMNAESRAAIKGPVIWLLLLAGWMTVQLVPLPADMWSALPGRQPIFRIDQLLGQSDIWRPISLQPSKTWNSLVSLVVPAAALLMFAAVEDEDRSTLFTGLIWVGVASALLSIMQIWMSKTDLLYFYRITNRDGMVGLFANRNHHATFLSCVLVLTGLSMRHALLERHKRALLIVGLAATGFLMIIVLLAIGSRAGLVTGAVALAACVAMIWPVISQIGTAAGGRQADGRLRSKGARFLVFGVLPLLVLTGLVLLFFAAEQTNSISRSLSGNYASDMRGQTLSVITELMRANWLFGTGYGSFAGVYRMVEPDSLLQPEYFNHAHNDWLQPVIEGGLPMVLLILVAVGWIGKKLFAVWRSRQTGARGPGLADMFAVGSIIVIFMLASAGDYPIRTPSLTALLALMIVLVSRSRITSRIVRS